MYLCTKICAKMSFTYLDPMDACKKTIAQRNRDKHAEIAESEQNVLTMLSSGYCFYCTRVLSVHNERGKDGRKHLC